MQFFDQCLLMGTFVVVRREGAIGSTVFTMKFLLASYGSSIVPEVARATTATGIGDHAVSFALTGIGRGAHRQAHTGSVASRTTCADKEKAQGKLFYV